MVSGNRQYSWPCVNSVLFPLISSFGSFPGLGQFPNVLVLISALLNSPEGSSADSWSSLSLQFSPLWNSFLQIPAILSSPDF